MTFFLYFYSLLTFNRTLMSGSVKRMDFQRILELMRKYDKESIYKKVSRIPESDDLYEALDEYVDLKSLTKVAVLGIDIYRYGLYKHLEQTMIPVLFKILFEKAIRLCLENNPYIFQRYNRDRLERSFISTGDGGFLVFDTPIHALFFSINFEVMVRAYNAYHLFPKLRKIIGSISLRYAITRDTIFSFDNNYYGSAIINNARILEKDSLNRCLIDQNTYDWFLANMDGVENLQVYTTEDIGNIYEFLDYKKDFITEEGNGILDTEVSRRSGIINVDILKIGQIRSKEIQMNIYNLHLQVTIKIYADDQKESKRTITVTLGNLNTAGI